MEATLMYLTGNDSRLRKNYISALSTPVHLLLFSWKGG